MGSMGRKPKIIHNPWRGFAPCTMFSVIIERIITGRAQQRHHELGKGYSTWTGLYNDLTLAQEAAEGFFRHAGDVWVLRVRVLEQLGPCGRELRVPDSCSACRPSCGSL